MVLPCQKRRCRCATHFTLHESLSTTSYFPGPEVLVDWFDLLAESEDCGGELGGVVADDGVFTGEVAGDALDAESLNALNVGDDGRGLLGGVTGEGLRREG